MLKRILAVVSLCVAESGFGAESNTLDNGLEVVLEENHASPMVAAMVFVKAGSRFELPHQNGVTHFLEHLLFNGTSGRSQEQIEPVIESFGGYINAFTRKEMTGYLVLMPREYIDTGLAVLSDMLFESIIPAEKLEKERGIVSEEIRRDTDSPDYHVQTAFDAVRFRGTPYARPVLGNLNIIATITRDEVVDYYRSHYVPQHMSVLVIGDFETAAMRSSVTRYFGHVFAPARAEDQAEEAGKLSDLGRWFQTEYADVPAPRLLVSIPAFAPLAPTFPALEVWTAYLNLPGSSPFLAGLLEGESAVATGASVALEIREGGSDLMLDVTLKPGADSAAALAAALQGLVESARQLPDEATLGVLSTAARAEEYALLERLHYYGIMRAQEIGILGWEHASRRVDRMSEVTTRDLQEALSVFRNGVSQYVALYVSTPPPAQAGSARSADRFLSRTFPNGLVAVVKSNPDSKIFGASLLYKNRSASEPAGKSGLVDLAQRLLPRGTQDMDEGELSRALASLGATLTTADDPRIPYDDFYTSPQFSFIKMSALDTHAAEALDLLHTMVSRPRFDSAQVAQLLGELGAAYGMQAQSAGYAARHRMLESLFAGGPLASDVLGNPSVTGTVTPAELKSFWLEYAAPGNTVLSVATAAHPDTAMGWIAATFGSVPSVESRVRRAQAAPAVDEAAKFHTPMQKAQIQICLGRPTCGPRDSDAAALTLAVRLLSDRLAGELREKQGLAYSVGASIEYAPDFGWLVCSMGTAPENREKALSGMKLEMKRLLSEPPSELELASARNQWVGRNLMRRLARETQCYYMSLGEFLGLGYRYDEELEAKLKEITPEDITRVVERFIATDRWIVSTAGPGDAPALTKQP